MLRPRDLLLALRLDEGDIEADLPLSASVRAEIASGRHAADCAGRSCLRKPAASSTAQRATVTIDIDRAEFRFNWDAQHRRLSSRFRSIRAATSSPCAPNGGGARRDRNGVWLAHDCTRGDAGHRSGHPGASGRRTTRAFALNRVTARARVDTLLTRIDVEQGDFSRIDTRPAHNVGVAVTGSLDYSGAEPRLAFGVAGTRMPMLGDEADVAGIRGVRRSAPGSNDHISGGIVERVVIAGNAPLADFKTDGPPMPEEGLSIDIETSGTTLQPIGNLPAIRDADLNVHVTGATANVSLGRGTVEVAPGRKLNIAGGVFAVPDTHLKPAARQRAIPHRRNGAGRGHLVIQRRVARHRRAGARPGDQPRHRHGSGDVQCGAGARRDVRSCRRPTASPPTSPISPPTTC